MVVLITGATGGLGPTVVRAFEDAGATVAATSRKADKWPADLSDAVATREMVNAVAGQFGRIDALVHLAGGFAAGAVHETDDATWDQMMNMNLRSAFHIFRSVIPYMRKAGGRADRRDWEPGGGRSGPGHRGVCRVEGGAGVAHPEYLPGE